MPNLTAAAYAAILDPERTIEDWWDYACPECGESKGDHSVACFDRPDYTHAYYGPDDLHTAREHAWRGEDWLEARGYMWKRQYGWTSVGKYPLVISKENHTAALVAAIERVNE